MLKMLLCGVSGIIAAGAPKADLAPNELYFWKLKSHMIVLHQLQVAGWVAAAFQVAAKMPTRRRQP